MDVRTCAPHSHTLYRDALLHIARVDPALARVIERVGACRFTPRSEGTHFAHIARAIIYQQLSGKAAGTIHRRFEELYGGRAPTPAELLETPDDRLRAVGVSRQKAAYLKDLAAKVAGGTVPLDEIEALDDDAIIRALATVKGVGRWTAQMFLMFRLGRPDVLPELDLGVQRGIQLAYGLSALPKPKELQRIGEKWSPYRSIAAWYLWRSLEHPETVAVRGKEGAGVRGVKGRSRARSATNPTRRGSK